MTPPKLYQSIGKPRKVHPCGWPRQAKHLSIEVIGDAVPPLFGHLQTCASAQQLYAERYQSVIDGAVCAQVVGHEEIPVVTCTTPVFGMLYPAQEVVVKRPDTVNPDYSFVFIAVTGLVLYLYTCSWVDVLAAAP